MSWTRYSEGIALVVALVVSLAAVGTVAAVTIEQQTSPDEAAVGQEITVEYRVSDLYSDNDAWTLNGTTQLENVTGWEVTTVTPSGQEETTSFEGSQSFSLEIRSEQNLDHVDVTITGDTPAVENWSYDPKQSFDAATFRAIKGDNENTLETFTVNHYTNASKDAWNTIRDAEQAVNGSESEQAQNRLQTAIDAYNDGSFDVAKSNANDAKQTAESAKQSQQTMQLVLYAVAGLVVLALIGGGIYYWQSQKDDYDRLR